MSYMFHVWCGMIYLFRMFHKLVYEIAVYSCYRYRKEVYKIKRKGKGVIQLNCRCQIVASDVGSYIGWYLNDDTWRKLRWALYSAPLEWMTRTCHLSVRTDWVRLIFTPQILFTLYQRVNLSSRLFFSLNL